MQSPPTLTPQLAKQVADYQPSPEKLHKVAGVPIILLVGISGVGKNALMTKLLHDYPSDYQRFITHTTRQPRVNNGVEEQSGHDYHFIDFVTAKSMLDQHQFIEANIYGTNIYGTSIGELEQAKTSGKILLGDVDVNGADHILQLLPQNTRIVFLLPPDYSTWQRRLLRRYGSHGIDKVDWHHRMRTAANELKHALANESFCLLVNDNLEELVQEVKVLTHSQHPDGRPDEAIKIAQQLLQQINQADALTNL